jgi:adenosylhomocysteine nucleosidase
MIAIMGAMPEEVQGIIDLMEDVQVQEIGMRAYHVGKINNKPCVVVFSRWGKVAASSTASTLIHVFKAKEIIFTGVAGAIASHINVGDIIIGSKLYQHDMDARPLIPQFEIPLLNKLHFELEETRKNKTTELLQRAIDSKSIFKHISQESINKFNLNQTKLEVGVIASGDQFFSSQEQKNNLQNQIPEVLCVEMEGSAVAQVCFENNIPFTIIRTISDAANDSASIDFPDFVKEITAPFTAAIIATLLQE